MGTSSYHEPVALRDPGALVDRRFGAGRGGTPSPAVHFPVAGLEGEVVIDVQFPEPGSHRWWDDSSVGRCPPDPVLRHHRPPSAHPARASPDRPRATALA